MTREEILEGLYKIKNWKCNGDAETHEIVTEAIKALKQRSPCEDTTNTNVGSKMQAEPCEDAISREDAIKAVDHHTFDTDDGLYLDEDISIILEELPPVAPTQKWIHVSEEYPNIEDEYKYFLVTDEKGKVSVQKFLLSLDEEPQPYFSGMVNVIAWMPLPKAYKAESEDK